MIHSEELNYPRGVPLLLSTCIIFMLNILGGSAGVRRPKDGMGNKTPWVVNCWVKPILSNGWFSHVRTVVSFVPVTLTCPDDHRPYSVRRITRTFMWVCWSTRASNGATAGFDKHKRRTHTWTTWLCIFLSWCWGVSQYIKKWIYLQPQPWKRDQLVHVDSPKNLRKRRCHVTGFDASSVIFLFLFPV